MTNDKFDEPEDKSEETEKKKATDALEERKKTAAKKMLEQAPLVFTSSVNKTKKRNQIETDDLEISDAVWQAIRKGEMIKFLPTFLPSTEHKKVKDLKTKVKDSTHCEIESPKSKILDILRKKGGLAFVVSISNLKEESESIEPIRLMIAAARVTVELEIDERIKQMLGDTDHLSDAVLEEKHQQARIQLLKTRPNILHFTISAVAHAKDVVSMLTEMKSSNPVLNATLTGEVIGKIQQEMIPLPKIIQDQIDKQQGIKPRPMPTANLTPTPNTNTEENKPKKQ